MPGRVCPGRPVTVDGIEIEDGPRFAWRGVHLDVARHFFPKSFVLKLVDLDEPPQIQRASSPPDRRPGLALSRSTVTRCSPK